MTDIGVLGLPNFISGSYVLGNDVCPYPHTRRGERPRPPAVGFDGCPYNVRPYRFAHLPMRVWCATPRAADVRPYDLPAFGNVRYPHPGLRLDLRSNGADIGRPLPNTKQPPSTPKQPHPITTKKDYDLLLVNHSLFNTQIHTQIPIKIPSQTPLKPTQKLPALTAIFPIPFILFACFYNAINHGCRPKEKHG